jgi:hypothetical protein
MLGLSLEAGGRLRVQPAGASSIHVDNLAGIRLQVRVVKPKLADLVAELVPRTARV